MNRKGMPGAEIMITLIFIVAVIAVGVYIIYTQATKNKGNIEDLQRCEGLVGSLGGKSGGCFDDKACTSPSSSASGTAPQQSGAQETAGKRWQYIGEGYGCAKYCCIELGEGDGVLRADDIKKAQCAAKLTIEGTANVYQSPDCKSISGKVQLKPGVATFSYKLTADEMKNAKLYCGVANRGVTDKYVGKLCSSGKGGIVMFDNVDPASAFGDLGNLGFYTKNPDKANEADKGMTWKIPFSITTS